MEVLDRRALNRALLARQLLLERSDVTPVEAVEHLVGLQRQAPNPPYLGLWTRLADFHHDDLSGLVESLAVVRIALMRSTIHLVSARDCLALRPVIQPVIEREPQRARVQADAEALARWARPVLEETPRTQREIGELAAAAFPGHDPGFLARIVRALLPLVQVPPRGLWGRSGPAAHTTAEHWLGRPLAAATAPDELMRRYLAAFGPASVADAQTWSGLAGLRAVFERLRPDLVTFHDENGRELFDLPDAPRPPADTPAPARLLPEFDNVLLSHADRTRIIDSDVKPSLASRNGMVPSVFLVDGMVAGMWRIVRAGSAAEVEFMPFGRLRKVDKDALTKEAADAVRFIA